MTEIEIERSNDLADSPKRGKTRSELTRSHLFPDLRIRDIEVIEV